MIEYLNARDIYDRTLRIPYPYTAADAEQWFATVEKLTKQNGQTVKIYHSTSSANTARAQVLDFNMKQLGFDTKLLPTTPSVYYRNLGIRGVDEDIALAGWCSDYADPFDFINVLLDGGTMARPER